MTDNTGDDFSGESSGYSQSSSDKMSSSSSILESGDEPYQLEQQVRGDREMASTDRGGLFAPRDDEDPRAWVTDDPWHWPSYFFDHRDDVFTEVYTHEDGNREEWLLYILGKDSSICSKYNKRRIPIYDIVFREMGIRLPFSDFEVAVFRHLRLAPSQLHLNDCVHASVRDRL